MKKRLAAILLVLAMITTYMPTIAFAEVEETTEKAAVEEIVEELTEEEAEAEKVAAEKTEKSEVKAEKKSTEEVTEENKTEKFGFDMPVYPVPSKDATIELSVCADMSIGSLLEAMKLEGPTKSVVLKQEGKDDIVVNKLKKLPKDAEGTYTYQAKKSNGDLVKEGKLVIRRYVDGVKVFKDMDPDYVGWVDLFVDKTELHNWEANHDTYKLYTDQTITFRVIPEKDWELDTLKISGQAVDPEEGVKFATNLLDKNGNLFVKATFKKTVVKTCVKVNRQVAMFIEDEASLKSIILMQGAITVVDEFCKALCIDKDDIEVEVINEEGQLKLGKNIVKVTYKDEGIYLGSVGYVTVNVFEKAIATKTFVSNVKTTYGDDYTIPVKVTNPFGVKLPVSEEHLLYEYTGFNYKSSEKPTDAGLYLVKVTYTGTEEPWPYKGSVGYAWLYIAPQVINVTIDDKTVMYGEEPLELTYVATTASGANLGTVEGFEPFVWNASKNVGTYLIYGFSFNRNYVANVTPGTYTITKRPLTFTWTLDKEDKNLVKYDGKPHTAEVTPENIIAEDIPVIETVYTNNVNTLPGTYTARADLHSETVADPESVPASRLMPATCNFNFKDAIAQAADTAKAVKTVETVKPCEGAANDLFSAEAPKISAADIPALASELTASQVIEVVENYEPLNSEFTYTIQDDIEISDLDIIDTGDNNEMMPFAVAGIIALAGIVTLLVVRRKKTN